jgi:hypothetical protein
LPTWAWQSWQERAAIYRQQQAATTIAAGIQAAEVAATSPLYSDSLQDNTIDYEEAAGKQFVSSKNSRSNKRDSNMNSSSNRNSSINKICPRSSDDLQYNKLNYN